MTSTYACESTGLYNQPTISRCLPRLLPAATKLDRWQRNNRQETQAEQAPACYEKAIYAADIIETRIGNMFAIARS